MANLFTSLNLQSSAIQVSPELVCLGDPHMGRIFKTGVPLDRRGEREALQLDAFHLALNNFESTTTTHVCMGDLFDSYRVPEEIILTVAKAYKDAANSNPAVRYVILSGNHDLSRDRAKKSSFEVLEALLANIDNICIPTEPVVINGVGIVPWHPFKNSHDLATQLTGDMDYVCGHWDFLVFGENTDNAIPYAALATKCHNIITGHYHRRGIHTVTNEQQSFHVLIAGSMQPYAHGEDVFETLYKTLTLTQAQEQLDVDPDCFKHICLRVEVLPDEVPLENVNCLALTHKRLSTQSQNTTLDVEADAFDLEAVYRNAAKQNNVSTDLTNKLWIQIAAKNL